jgi:hypothetical protein
MPKKRKTKEQKILAGQKTQTVHRPVLSNISIPENKPQQTLTGRETFSLPSMPTDKSTARKTSATTITILTDEYKYLSVDLLKTAIVTCAIAITEIIIHVLFRG